MTHTTYHLPYAVTRLISVEPFLHSPIHFYGLVLNEAQGRLDILHNLFSAAYRKHVPVWIVLMIANWLLAVNLACHLT